MCHCFITGSMVPLETVARSFPEVYIWFQVQEIYMFLECSKGLQI